MIIRGTTPEISYKFPFSVDSITKLRMYFIQGKDVVLEKTEEDCTLSGSTISVTLTQEETYSFSPKKLLKHRMRFIKDGEVCGTLPKNTRVEGEDAASSEVL